MQPIAILKDLIALPSVNPMGRTVAGPEFLEGRMTDYLVDYFARLGVPFQRIEVVPGRANVVARLDRPGSKTTLLFDAHQDTVPVDGMTIAPFEPSNATAASTAAAPATSRGAWPPCSRPSRGWSASGRRAPPTW